MFDNMVLQSLMSSLFKLVTGGGDMCVLQIGLHQMRWVVLLLKKATLRREKSLAATSTMTQIKDVIELVVFKDGHLMQGHVSLATVTMAWPHNEKCLC